MSKASEKTTNRLASRNRYFDIYVVSEATGSLAKHIASVLLSQFPNLEHKVHYHPFCSNANASRKVRQAISASESPIVLSALTKPTLKRSLTTCVRAS